jgi:hypothetical protein
MDREPPLDLPYFWISIVKPEGRRKVIERRPYVDEKQILLPPSGIGLTGLEMAGRPGSSGPLIHPAGRDGSEKQVPRLRSG